MTTFYVIDTLTGNLGKIVAKSQMYALLIWIWMLISPDEFDFKTINKRQFYDTMNQYGNPFRAVIDVTKQGKKIGSLEFFKK